MNLDVEDILRKKNIPYRLFRVKNRVITHADVIKYVNEADPDDDCKTIIAVDQDDNLYGLFLRGMMKINFKKIRTIIGKKIKIIDKQKIKYIINKEPGEISILLLNNAKLLCDKRVFERKNIQFSSGDYRFGLEIQSKNLNKIIDFQIGDFAE